VLAIGTRLDGRQLTAFQSRADRHVSFSVTTACPLRCRHCLVATVSARDHAAVALPAERAARFAAQLPALAAEGVERISFTGGEPLLAEDLLRQLSGEAIAAGMECTVVTACHWARTPEQARDVIARLPDIRRWHLSMDRYHVEYLPLDHVAHAAQAAVDLGRDALIRASVPDPPTDEDEQLLRDVVSRLPPAVELAVQPVKRVGRATALPLGLPSQSATATQLSPRAAWIPCMTTGPLVLADGGVRPCCSSLADGVADHPFRMPSADELGMVGAYRAWRDDPLLKLVRAVGFAPVFDWVVEGSGAPPLPALVPAHPCDQCTLLWKTPGASKRVRVRIADAGVRRKIDELHDAVFACTTPA